MATMKDTTPYRERPAGERDRERRCMAHIFELAPQVDQIFEAFGGTGDTAEIMSKTFPQANIWSFDLDGDCCRVYAERQIPRSTIIQGDALAGARVAMRENGLVWGASLDYNKFTLLDLTSRSSWRRSLLNTVMDRQPRWVQLTDSARPYLHLNWERYGLKDRDILGYIAAVLEWFRALWGYELQTWDSHSRASYLLFVRR